jgi:hypothetical protein
VHSPVELYASARRGSYYGRHQSEGERCSTGELAFAPYLGMYLRVTNVLSLEKVDKVLFRMLYYVSITIFLPMKRVWDYNHRTVDSSPKAVAIEPLLITLKQRFACALGPGLCCLIVRTSDRGWDR